MTLSVAREATVTSGWAPARSGAEAIVQLFAPLQDAVVALGRDGQPVPKIVPCPYRGMGGPEAHGMACNKSLVVGKEKV